MDNISGVRKSQEGYAYTEGEYLHLSVLNGHSVEITFSGSGDHDVVGRTAFFNNHSAAVTIAAHETHDLFKWSKRFDSDEQLRFTWLLSPRTIDGRLPWLPYLALASGLLTIVVMMGVLGREGIGPMGGIMSQRKPSLEEE